MSVKLFFTASIFFFALQGFGQTLFTYGKNSVSRQDFLKAYSKNAPEEKPTEQSLREYLDLYIKFKLKVQAALDLRLDTTERQKQELNSFRSEIIESYLNDDATIDVLIDEALQRSQKEIEVGHIFIRHDTKAAASGNPPAALKASSAAAAIRAGKSFEEVALQYSDDPAVKINKGILGYISPFVLPYELESAVYSLSKGGLSEPIRSKAGYHVFYNRNEKAGSGRLKVAQILLAFPPDADEASKEQIGRRADSLFNVIGVGAEFSAIATSYSNDLSTYPNGGMMPDFGVGEFDQAFERVAFALKEGETSKPFATAFGYHIIKLIGKIPPAGPGATPEERQAVRQKVLSSDRMNVAQAMFTEKIRKTTGLKMSNYDSKALFAWSDNVLKEKPATYPPGIKASSILFSYGDKPVTTSDWEKHLVQIRNSDEASKSVEELYNQFINLSTLDHYKKNLDKFNSDLRYQLQEFREGNLLFDVMQRKVWDIATADSIALVKYYNANKSKYKWEMSADAILFSVPDTATATMVKNQLEKNAANWRQLSAAGNGNILADSARFELSQIPVAERTNFTPGLITANVSNEVDNTITFSYIIRMYPDGQQRSFDEARGFVINDYQNQLEENWVKSLRKKYPVKINEGVFRSMLK